MTIHCLGATKVTINYSFNKGIKKKYVSKKPPLTVETSLEAAFGELQKFGTTAIVPTDWDGAKVYLCGIVYTAPNYPNCPSEYQDREIGTARPGQQLTIIFEPYPIGCNKAHFASVPATGHSDSSTQIPGQSAQIGLKQITNKCQIKVTDSIGQIFTDKGKCPIEYEVACDDECPPGFIKCLKPSYPGYCCIDCSEIKSEIAALRGAIKR